MFPYRNNQRYCCLQLVHEKIFSKNHTRLLHRKNTMESKKNFLAVCQINSCNNKENNFSVCEQMIKNAAHQGAKMVFLPEACDFIGVNKEETMKLSEPLSGSIMTKYKNLAKSNNVWLSFGIHEKVTDSKLFNTHVVVDKNGDVVKLYRKIHLFDVDLPQQNITLKESDFTISGSEVTPPVETPVGSVGLCTCYDLRFPEMGIMLKLMGANILTYPSAFTWKTGSMHWETLLRARAIENQVYVVAAAQTGSHSGDRRSWGHSMVVDPYGIIVGQCSDGVGSVLVEVDLSIPERLGVEMPVWQHRRYDLYPKVLPLSTKNPDVKKENYQFGQVTVNSTSIFYVTDMTMAFTNKRCVVPGHVLVAPLRVAKRLRDLSSAEVADLFKVVQKVEEVMELHHGSSSSTVSVQDGPLAGQTIEHVHVHILPRKKGDFVRNDDIYYELEDHDKFEKMPERSNEEMAAEAEELKKYFYNKKTFLKD